MSVTWREAMAQPDHWSAFPREETGLGTSTCSAVPQRLCMKVVTMSPYSSAPVTASHHSFAPMLLEQWFNSASFICRPSLPPANPSASSSTSNAGAPRPIPAAGIRVHRRDLSAQLQVPRQRRTHSRTRLSSAPWAASASTDRLMLLES